MTMILLLHTTISLDLNGKGPTQEDQVSGLGRQLEARRVQQPAMRWAADVTHRMIGIQGQDHHSPDAMITVIEMVRLQGHHSLSPLLGQILVLDLRDEDECEGPFDICVRDQLGHCKCVMYYY